MRIVPEVEDEIRRVIRDSRAKDPLMAGLKGCLNRNSIAVSRTYT
jgi:hypothetical protein